MISLILLSQHHPVIAALGAGRSGVVNIITRHVSSCGRDIENSRLAMLEGKFTFIMLPSGSWNVIILTESTLPLKGAELDLLIVMKHTATCPRPSMPASVWVWVDVAGSLYLIECSITPLDTHHMNIVELVSCTQPAESERAAQLHIQITVHSPASTDAANTEQAFKALCTELNAQGSINVAGYPQHDEQNGIK